jgi:hypothetical protein
MVEGRQNEAVKHTIRRQVGHLGYLPVVEVAEEGPLLVESAYCSATPEAAHAEIDIRPSGVCRHG